MRHPHCAFTGKDIYGEKIKTFAHEGTPMNIAIADIPTLPAITKDFCNEYECIHGAYTSVTFQYSFVVEFTEYKAIWERKNKTSFTEDALSEVIKLASFNFTIKSISDNKAVIISPHYQKLESISKLLAYAIPFFNFKYIGCSRFDGDDLTESYNLNGADIIKAMQNTDRKFAVKWITDRMDKALN